MFSFKKKNNNETTLKEKALENLSKRAKKAAKLLIKEVDESLLFNSNRGYGYGSINYRNYNFKVDAEVLDIMVEHYKALGFEVKADYPSNNTRDGTTFTVRCD